MSKKIKKVQKLSDELLYSLNQPEDSKCRFVLRDSLVSSFSVTVSSRSMSFFLEANHLGKRKSIAIGRFPHVCVLDARKRAIDILSN